VSASFKPIHSAAVTRAAGRQLNVVEGLKIEPVKIQGATLTEREREELAAAREEF
jgi:hypothetical protein